MQKLSSSVTALTSLVRKMTQKKKGQDEDFMAGDGEVSITLGKLSISRCLQHLQAFTLMSSTSRQFYNPEGRSLAEMGRI